MAYFSGQGRVLVATRDANGNPGAFRLVGNCPELRISLSTDVAEHHESVSGSRLLDARLVRQNKGNVSMTLEDVNWDNLAMALYGTKATIAGGTVAQDGETFPSGLVAGDYVRTKYPKISATTIRDSAGTPATLALTTGYVIDSAANGTIRIVNPGALVQPFKIGYTYGASVNTVMFSQPPQERWIRFEGLNTANSLSPVLVEVYRCIFDPLKDLSLITDDFGKLSMDGTLLYDSVRAADSVLGSFGRVMDVS